MQTTHRDRVPAAERARSEAPPCARRRGSILVEFALVSLAFYLILAGTLEVGRMITSAQIVQNAARTAARELALMPLPATMQFRAALACDNVRNRIFDPTLLAVSPVPTLAQTNGWPAVNRILLPLMVVSVVDGDAYLHYPGALVRVTNPDGTEEVVVRVPHVISRGADGVETIRWVDVIEEISANNSDPNGGPFSMTSQGPELGLVALRVNYPYQAVSMAAFQPVDIEEPNPVNEAILANDGGVSAPSAGGTLIGGSSTPGPNSGLYGLGKLYVLNKEVRPFRRLISGQAVFRREVFSAGSGCN